MGSSNSATERAVQTMSAPERLHSTAWQAIENNDGKEVEARAGLEALPAAVSTVEDMLPTPSP